MVVERNGRPRRYKTSSVEGITSPEMTNYLSLLDEMRERVLDQVADLPVEILNDSSKLMNISIGKLALHMAWAEFDWMTNVAKCQNVSPRSDSLKEDLDVFSLERMYDPAPQMIGRELIAGLYARTRSEMTLPVSRLIGDMDARMPIESPLSTPREVYQHLLWHWSYHSGQIGIIALTLGYDYTWTFEQRSR